MNVFTTGRQFSNIWLRIEDGYSLSLGTDDGTGDDPRRSRKRWSWPINSTNWWSTTTPIYADPVAEDDDV